MNIYELARQRIAATEAVKPVASVGLSERGRLVKTLVPEEPKYTKPAVQLTAEERKAKQKAYSHAWYMAHREECNARSKAYSKTHREACRKSSRKYYRAHAAELNAKSAQWRKDHPEQYNALMREYRRRKSAEAKGETNA